MLVLAPAACCLAGLALHQLLLTLTRSLNAQAQAGATVDAPTPAKEAAPRKPSKAGKVPHHISVKFVCSGRHFACYNSQKKKATLPCSSPLHCHMTS